MFSDHKNKHAAVLRLLRHVNRILKTAHIIFEASVILMLATAVTPAYPEDILDVQAPVYSECGNVSVNGYVNTNPFGLVWDWGDGSKTTSWFPAGHRYTANGTFTITVTAAACNTLTQTETAVITNAEGSGCPSAGTRTFNNLKPYNMHLNVGQTSGVPLHVVNQDGYSVSGTPSFTIYNPYQAGAALISINSSGYVTALRAEDTANEYGVWVDAVLTVVPIASNSVVRVLPVGYAIPGFTEVIGEKTALYYPPTINGEDIAAMVADFQIPTVNEYAYQIENRLMAIDPFSGARQIFEVDFGITEENRVCGISGNPIRLGWNLAGDAWRNCFLVPFPVWDPPPPRSPQWGIFYHELGHNMLGPSPVFSTGLGHYFYSEGLATAMKMAAIEEILAKPATYPVGSYASLSLQWVLDQDTTGSGSFIQKRQNWISAGAPFSGVNPDIVDGIWLYHKAGVPRFADRFFLPLQPSSLAGLGDVLCSVQNAGDDGKHTFFAALMSAAAGTDLYSTFLNNYHYPLIQGLYNSAHPALTAIIAQRGCPGDFDHNGSSDNTDLAVFAANFGKNNCAGGCTGDMNADGDVDGSDLKTFILKFGRTDCL
jgi:hypothetical protein